MIKGEGEEVLEVVYVSTVTISVKICHVMKVKQDKMALKARIIENILCILYKKRRRIYERFERKGLAMKENDGILTLIPSGEFEATTGEGFSHCDNIMEVKKL